MDSYGYWAIAAILGMILFWTLVAMIISWGDSRSFSYRRESARRILITMGVGPVICLAWPLAIPAGAMIGLIYLINKLMKDAYPNRRSDLK